MGEAHSTVLNWRPPTFEACIRVAVVLLGAAVALWTALIPSNQSATVAMGAALVAAVYSLIICRRNWMLVIVFFFLAYCSYSILCAQYLNIVGNSPYNCC